MHAFINKYIYYVIIIIFIIWQFDKVWLSRDGTEKKIMLFYIKI